MANYLVTGAAGFIGAAVAKKLVEQNHFVATIDNLSTGFKKNIPEGVNFIEGDCADHSVYKKIPDMKYDAIFHIAGQSSGEISFDDPIYDIQTNAESTLLLLKYALNNQCSRFIYASTMSVYGAKSDRPISENDSCVPESFYGVGKLASEHYMRIYKRYGIDSTSMRLFNVYGPGQNMENLRQGMVSIFFSQLANDNKIHVKGSSDRYRDFIYIDDVVSAFLACLTNEESKNKIINIATGVKTTVRELIDLLIKTSGKNVSVKYHGSTQGDVHGIYADNQMMKELLSPAKLTTLCDGLKKMWESSNSL